MDFLSHGRSRVPFFDISRPPLKPPCSPFVNGFSQVHMVLRMKCAGVELFYLPEKNRVGGLLHVAGKPPRDFI
jgi:hypothetical protein